MEVLDSTSLTDIYITDYSCVLERYKLEYTPASYYWQIGQIPKNAGWVLHLSGTKCNLVEMLKLVVPYLVEERVCFKIVKDLFTAEGLLSGAFGYFNLGKLVCIYPSIDSVANDISIALVKLLGDINGPEIPTDRHLGSVVYTCYDYFFLNSNVNEVSSEEKRRDYSTIPFRIPDDIHWPFMTVSPSSDKPKGPLLNNRYYPIKVIKPDAKGRVLKAIYFEKWWKIRACIVKEGKRGMIDDWSGRDIRDRILWQHELYQSLKESIPLPKVLDIFSNGSDQYIVFEFLKGGAVAEWKEGIYRGRCWEDLTISDKFLLIDTFLKILEIIKNLHSLGVIHRDINSFNMMIDRKNKIHLIDMELAWSQKGQRPDPPFSRGTEGFMSPEQLRQIIPTVEQDQYALGAMAIEFFTNLHPLQLDQESTSKLHSAILYLSGSKLLAEFISKCHSNLPKERPTLEKFTSAISQFRDGLSVNERLCLNHNGLNGDMIIDCVRRAIQYFNTTFLAHPEFGWYSVKASEDAHIGNEQIEVVLREGWYSGMTGIVWVILSASYSGFLGQSKFDAYHNSLDFIRKKVYSGSIESGGFYDGGAGVAMLMFCTHKQDAFDLESRKMIMRLFLLPSIGLDIAKGKAGVGLAMLFCWQDYIEFGEIIADCVDSIIDAQRNDGSWNLLAGISGKRGVYFGLKKGMSGIVLFLLAYLNRFKEERVERVVRLALDWLIRRGKKDKNTICWAISSNVSEIDYMSLNYGMPGIVLCLIKAYEVLNDPFYASLAQSCLDTFPDRPVSTDLSLGDGLAGLGELYLDAWQSFKNPKWHKRAEWICGLLCSCGKGTYDGNLYWIPKINNIVTGGLFNGMGGILHFLMRYEKAEAVGNPFWPSTSFTCSAIVKGPENI